MKIYMKSISKLCFSVFLALAICVAMLPQDASAASKGSKGFSGKTSTSASADKIIKVAKSKLGCPYVSGAAGPSAFDCSGFVAYCMHKAGVKLTRGTAASYFKKKYNVGSNIKKAHKGDIVLYSAGSGIGHCALYIGHKKVIHATCHGGIRITSYNGIGQRVVAIIRTYTPVGSAKISVSDDNNTVAGTKFLVYKKGYKKTVSVNKNGVAKIGSLKAGSYKVKPLSVKSEYQSKFVKKLKVKYNKTAKVGYKNMLTSVANWEKAAKAAASAKAKVGR
jgi:hypothetical protein